MGTDGSTLECSALKDFTELIGAAWRKALKTLHDRGWSAAGMSPEIVTDPGVMPLIEATASVLDSALEQAPMSGAMRSALERSNFIFSGLKTFHELNEAFPSLVDDSGNLKPFNQFLTDVKNIDNTYNNNYLRAEYNFAVASAQSAAKWEQIEADGDRYDLQYRTANDDKVRPEHAALHGVTLPPSSPFWDSFMPPNGWNCRCSVVQVRKGKYPNIDVAEALELGERATIKDTRKMMRFNPGKERSIWPKYNPYTITRCRDCDIANGKTKLAKEDIPEGEQCEACQNLRDEDDKTPKRQNRMQKRRECRLSAEEWAKNHLPEVDLGNGQTAKRLFIEAQNKDNILVDADFIGETYSKNKRNRRLVKTMELATKVEDWLPMADVDGEDEIGKHHTCMFRVYTATYDGFRIVCKAMLKKEIRLYNMRIYEQEKAQ